MPLGRIGHWTFSSLCSVALILGVSLPSLAAIHPGDTLVVKVWNHPELSKQVTVDASGSIRVPLSGMVMVGGLNEVAAAKLLADSLRPMVLYPAVSIETVVQGTSIFASGGPIGVLKYQPGETLSAAIADEMASPTQTMLTFDESGQSLNKINDSSVALRSRIDLHDVKVRRDATTLGPFDTVAMGAHGDPGPLLEPGDTIEFASKPIEVRVLGEVGQPGTTYLSNDQALSEAITQAGGLLPTAVLNHVTLQRAGVTQSLALGDPAFSEPAQPGDVITVPQAPRVEVVGTVMQPGVVALKTDSSLLSALYTAGGPTRYANLRDVQIVRGSQTTSYDITQLTHGDVTQNPTLRDGDTVVVPEGHKFDFSGIFGILGGVAAGLATRL